MNRKLIFVLIMFTFQGLPEAAPILFSFLLPVCNARPIDIYIDIYIICIPTRNRNNEFIL